MAGCSGAWQVGLLGLLALLVGACAAPKGAPGGAAAADSGLTEDDDTDDDLGLRPGWQGGAPIDPAAPCGRREIDLRWGSPYDPVDTADVLRLCAEDPTPDLRVTGDLIVPRRASLVGLPCLCAVEGELQLDLRAEPEGSAGALDTLAGLQLVWEFTLIGDASVEELGWLRGLGGAHDLTLVDLPALRTLDGIPPLDGGQDLHLEALPLIEGLGALDDSPWLHRLTLVDLPLLALDSLPPVDGPVAHLTLTDLPGLRGLRGVGLSGEAHSVTLTDLPALTDLSPLSGLTALFGSLRLSGLPGVSSLRGLDGLTEAEAVVLSDMDGLRRLDGLGGLASVGTLEITDSDALRSTAGLGPALAVGALTVERLPALTRLGEGGAPAVGTLVADDLGALVAAELTVCAVGEQCDVFMTGLPQLAALPAFGEVGLGALLLRDLPALEGLGREVRVSWATVLALVGLERLERLDLSMTSVSDLPVPPLGRVDLVDLPALRRLGWPRPVSVSTIRLVNIPLLTDLEGIGLAPHWLEVESLPRLETLRGLEVPPDPVGGVTLTDLPALRSLEGLDRLRMGSWLHLEDLPALTDLDALTGYTQVGTLWLERTGVAALRLPPAPFNQTRAITAIDNPALRTADLSALGWWGSLRISDSPDFAGFTAPVETAGLSTVELVRLGALTDIEALRPLTRVQRVTISENPLLSDASWICAIATVSCTVSP